MFKIILIFIVLTLIACSNSSHGPSPQGGQDSGGGNTSNSSIEDVEFYFNRVMPVIHKVLAEFFLESTISNFKKIEDQNLLRKVVLQISIQQKKDGFSYNSDNENYMNFIRLKDDIKEKLVDASVIQVKKSESCSSVDKTHASASIKYLKIGSPICLSFLELTKVTKHSLEREIMGLLLHEYVHALGHNEEIAKKIQKSFLLNYDKIFPNGLRSSLDRKPVTIFNDSTPISQLRREELESAIADFLEDTPAVTEEYEPLGWPTFAQMMLDIPDIIRQSKDENLLLLSRLSTHFVDVKELTENDIDKHIENLEYLQSEIKYYMGEVGKGKEPNKNLLITAENSKSLAKLFDALSRFYIAIGSIEKLAKSYN